jgi:predicted dienelactone hydrolase
MNRQASGIRLGLGVALLALVGAAQAGMGFMQLPATEQDGPLSVYYPTHAAEAPPTPAQLSLTLAVGGEPVRGNGRLVVISHGSGGSPFVHGNLARTLVDAGFVVALPEHRGDNFKDLTRAGPEAWSTRPLEVSRAIDAIGADARFGPLLQLDRVGVFGFSAGGHTALTLAGGRWSAARFKQHCEAHIAEDFHTCVAMFLRLTGGPFDGFKQWLALNVIRARFGDDTLQQHADPRVAAVVSGAPHAVSFDAASLAQPRVPLGLVTLAQDRWLVPRFHLGRVLQACTPCERNAELPSAGHGALLSPLPPGLGGLAAELLGDPPGFDRSVLPEVDRAIAAFFGRHLPAAGPAAEAPAPAAAAGSSSVAGRTASPAPR